MARVPRPANVAARSGVSYESGGELVYRRCWLLEVFTTAEEAEKAASDAAHSESIIQMTTPRIDAFDIQMVDTRRAICAGVLMRSDFAVFSQMPHLLTPGIRQLSKQALGTVGGGYEASGS